MKTSKPSTTGDGNLRDQLTRSAFVQVPLDLLTAARDRKGLVFVYGWLWHHAGTADAAFPTIARLEQECGMKGDDIRRSLRVLVDQGWIEKHERPGFATVYHVRSERIRPRSHPSPKRGTPPPNGGSPKQGGGPLPQMGGDTNKKPLTRTKLKNQDPPFAPPHGSEQPRRPSVSDTPPDHVEKAPSPQPVENPVENPIMPTFLISDPSFLEPRAPQTPPESPLSVQKQPQQPIPPWGQPRPLEGPSEAPVKKQASKAKSAVFCPNNDDVPAALLPVSEKIIAFWQHKAGKKTPQAWSLLIQELTKINDFVNGGLDAVSEQCDLGIKARINGKGWMSITLNNFIKMGGGSSKPRQRYGRQDVLEKAHEASQIVKKLKERQAREEAEFFAMMDCTSLSQGAV